MELCIFQHILRDPAIANLLAGHGSDAMQDIILFAETSAVTDDAVKEYIISLLANDENILSFLAQSGKTIGDSLHDAALSDLETIFETLLEPSYMLYRPSGNAPGFFTGYISSIRTLCAQTSPSALLDALIVHYRTLGCGVLAKYIAFKYDNGLCGISDTDTITFDSLIGLDYQKQILIDNTKAFVDRKRANNVLLFGDRGTGKSSSVKALLNLFYPEGLRVIELPKQAISSIPSLMQTLSAKPHQYILFLDDLSFEAHESDYRALKVAMEGQLQASPANVLVYATSNRRHLIKESWADREGGDVHVNDNLQETLSLSERFGISLVFSAPTQKEYLNIVSELLSQHQIDMTAEIERKAIVWQMNYSGRSGRCAKQFVSSYLSKLGTK
jgi:predicted AAA+ superfamily ATPase|nr:MAG TPA: Protein of unknown function (DUF815) [Caudoviricetes sp.]